ncbi:iron-sulfur protein NUBPL [Coccinella septempunctata]|uniref:iron-sulfur protein NUBPL n=1 Tax=Coccinella septempunctata TaxID=41139 RepID=UPI001D063167|nr:iron-sulfur protein NUBPL [Coccinella septempunctata]
MIFRTAYLTNIHSVFFKSMRHSMRIARKMQSQSESHKSKIMARGLPKKTPIDGVKNIILVSSGKGGVGKSTISVNLALALKHIRPTKNVGLLDSDVFGPSIPLMMNLAEIPQINDDKMIEPLQNYGIKCMSMGFLMEPGAPIIWRGLMVMQALQKLMRGVNWKETDYLIVDTPPGTGDTHLSLIQNLPITGVILVTTPQVAALQVTERGANMLNKLSVPIIGILENMTSTVCPNCSTEISLFGTKTKDLANAINCIILERLPLENYISESNDRGTPIVIENPDHPVSASFKRLAKNVVDFCDNKSRITPYFVNFFLKVLPSRFTDSGLQTLLFA